MPEEIKPVNQKGYMAPIVPDFVGTGGTLPRGDGGNLDAYALMEKRLAGASRPSGETFTEVSATQLPGTGRYPKIFIGEDNEEIYAQGQTWGSKMVNGVGKGLSITGTTLLQSTAGLVNGIIQSLADGRAASFYDNDFNRNLDEFNKRLEDSLPNYYTQREKNAEWWSPDKLFTANFFWDGIVKNMGFAAGAAISGYGYAAGLKALSALPGMARLFSVGKAAETLAATEEAILTTGKAAETYGKVKSLSDKFLGAYNTLNKGQRALVAGLATTGEAGFEAYQNLNSFRDKKIEEYKAANGGLLPTEAEMDRINNEAENVGNSSFVANTILLSATNYIQFPKILGSSTKLEKGILDQTVKEIKETVKDASGKLIVAPSKYGKVVSAINKIRPYTFSIAEGFEEGAQFAIGKASESYYNKKYKGEGVSFTNEIMDSLAETFGTNEGMENVLIGGLSGAIMTARGRFREDRQKTRDTQKALTELNKTVLSDFTKETKDSISRGIVLQEEREKHLANGDVFASKDSEADYIINYLTPRIKYGRMDLVQADINEYRALASTEEGFAQLVAEGKAIEGESRPAYLQRLTQLENTAENVKSLYQSLTLRYGNKVMPDGKTPVYNKEVMNKMIYAATKVADYDVRIPQLSVQLNKAGIDTLSLVDDIANGNDEEFNKAVEDINKLRNSSTKVLNDDEIEDLDEALVDLAKATISRKEFVEEYNNLKKSPEKYTTETEDIDIDEEEDTVPRETIKVKTKDGEEDLEIGTEYFLGRRTLKGKDGNPVYAFPKLTIIGENEDGTIKIKDSEGGFHNMPKSELINFKLGKVSDTLNNKKAKYFLENVNNVFEHLGIKIDGKPATGRLEYSPKENVLLFVYKNKKGETKTREITREQFVARKGYAQGMVRKVGEVTLEEKKAEDEFKSQEDERITKNRESRLKILNDLFDEVSKNQDRITKLIQQKKNELGTISKELKELEEKIASGDITKKNNFKASTNKAIKAANRLSRMQEQLRLEIESLEAEKEESESTLAWISDLEDNISELPTDSNEFLEELKDQRSELEDLILATGQSINAVSDLLGTTESALKEAIDLLKRWVNKFEQAYPNVPTNFGQEWVDFLKGNPNFLKLAPKFKEDLAMLEDMVSQIEDFTIKPKEEEVALLNEELDKLQNNLKEAEKQLKIKDAIVSRFERVAKEYREKKAQEDKMMKDAALIKEILGTATNSVQTSEFQQKQEVDDKKSTVLIPRSTIGVMRGKAHQIRANRFGFNLNRFENRDRIRGVYITSKNEDKLIPGLTDKLRMDEAGQINEDIKKDQIIAMVMVEEDANGNIRLIGEDGQSIPEGVDPLEAAIYQVYPSENLKWGSEFNNKSMFREGTPDEVIAAVTEQYAKWRESVLKNEDINDIHEIEASFGRVDNTKDGDGNVLYDTRTSVQDAGLITPDNLEIDNLILIPTLPAGSNSNMAVVDKGTVRYTAAVGTVFLDLPNGAVKLQNRQHTAAEAENIFNAILTYANYMLDPEVGTKDPKAQRLLTWLKSVVYWGIPEDQQGNRKEAGYNSIFFEKDPDTGKLMLSISGKGKDFPFTPNSLRENKDLMLTLLKNMYNNINNDMASKTNESYEEITSISSDGEIVSRIWQNYQTYLLSNTNPDGSSRKGEELPLSTYMRPLVGEDDMNRSNIYFYTTDTADDFVIPVVKPKSTAGKVLTPGAPKPKIVESDDEVFLDDDGEDTPAPYKLDGNTRNFYVSPKSKKKLVFTATEDVNEKNYMSEIKVYKGEDFDSVVEALKAAGKNPEQEIKKQIFDSIVLQKPQQEEEEEDVVFDDADSIEEEIKTEIGEDEELSDDVLDAINNAMNEEDDDEVLRTVIENQVKDFEPENWSAVEAWLKKYFPRIPVYRVKNVIKATNGQQAWGMFKNGAIYIYENAEVGTAYHEVFHAVWRMFTDSAEQKAVINEMRSRKGTFFDRASLKDVKYSEATEKQLEEALAEEFRDYVQFKKIPVKPSEGRPFILKLFSDLISMIKEFFLGPNSDSRVEEMFSKIGGGYYKSHIPYETNLSFAKQGIIDIENAVADNDAVMSLIGISDVERADIINEMTYLTLADIIKTDKSLFSVPELNRQELYSRLKGQILQKVARKIVAARKLVDKKKITKEQAKPVIASTAQMMQNIDSQWADIVARHEEQLKSYSIEFDESDNINLRDENNSGRETYQDATKIDNFKKANSAIKLLLATLPELDSDGKIIRSSIGGARLLPVNRTYITLMNHLHNSKSVEDMMERLRTLAAQDVNYRTLYKRITKKDWVAKGVDLSNVKTTHAAQLISSFFGTFKKQAPDVKNVFILENGDVVVGEANLSTAAQKLKSQFVNEIIVNARAGKGFFKYDNVKKVFKGDPSKISGVTLDSPEKMVSFLNKMGVLIIMSDFNKMSVSQKQAFKDAVNGIRESISKTEEIATFSGKVLNIDKRLFTLGLLKSAIDNPDFSSTFFNVSGERTQTYIGTNAASDLSNFLSNLTKFTKEALSGTQYSYLITDSFAKGSNLISRKFSSNGTPKKGAEDLFTVGYVSGLINEEKGKQKESSKLNYKERLTQELNLNINGWYMNLVPGDASIEWMIKMGNAISVDSLNRGFDEINKIFREYFISELELARETNRPVVEGRDRKDMRFFKGILGKDLHREIINDPRSPEDIYKDKANEINRKLKSFIEADVKKLQATLNSYSILGVEEDGFFFDGVDIPSGLSEKQLTNHLTALSVNYMISNIEMHKLLYSDPYQYEDELKRIKNFNSPRQAIINSSPKMNAVLHRVWNRGYSNKKDIGHTKFTQDYFRSATHDDVIAFSSLPNYKPYKETDGAGIIGFKALRQFRIRAGNWNDNEELQFRYDIAWEKMDKNIPLNDDEKQFLDEEGKMDEKKNPNVKSAYTPIKPIVSGTKLGKDGLPNANNDILMDKFALYPISYRLIKQMNSDANIIKLYDKMQKEDIDYVVFKSSRKVGSEELHPTYKNGEFNNDSYKGVINVPFSIMSIQAEVPSKEDNYVTRGSQVTKLITLDFMEAGVPVDFMEDEPSFAKRYKAWYALTDKSSYNDGNNLFNEIKNNQDLLEALTNIGYKNTLRRLGIKESIFTDADGNIRKTFEITDKSKVIKTLREEIFKREVNDNISAALNAFLDGKVVLEATPAYQQVRNILYSIADKEFISPKMNGGMKVQIPSTFLEGGVREMKDGLYESDILKFYEKDGKRVAEVMLGRWFDSPMSDDELLNWFNNTEEGQKQLSILAGVGFRIPTQKQNSVDAIVIKKFLPREFGDSVVIPSALVEKAGSDFDIDKLSIYLKNVYIKDGKPKLIPYFGIGEQAINKFAELFDKGEFLTEEEMKELDRYISEETLLLQDIAKESASGKLISSIFGKLFSEEELTQEFTKGIPSKDQIINRLYKKSLENQYIQSMENLITHPKNYDNLIKPNSADPLKKLSKKIAEKTLGGTFDYKSVDNMLDRTFMSRLRHAFVTGKYAIGIAAVNQTNHSLNQRQPIYIDTDKLELASAIDKFWLDDASIKFSKYNTIEVDGKMVPTLSMIKNKAGENISDIIGMFIDGYVDISKGPWIMELGATPNVASTWLFLVKLGVPINTVAYFMNQPIVRQYLQTIENAGYSWLFIDSFAEKTIESYGEMPTIEQVRKFTIPSETSLESTVGKTFSDLTKQERLDQQLILKEFLKYAKMAEHMFHVTQGSNYDTATFNDPYLVFKKQMQQIVARNTIISSVDTLLSNSFVGNTASAIGDIRDGFAEVITSDQKNVRSVIQKVLLPFINMNDRDFIKLSQKAVNDLFDWAVQTDQGLNTMIKDILINDGGVGKEVIDFVKKAKNDRNLRDNLVVNMLESIPSTRTSNEGVNNVRVELGDNRVYDQNNIIYAFREIRDYLKGKNDPLYERIKLLAVLQSGLSTSRLSFTSLLPHEDFEEIYGKTLSKLNSIPNLEDFYKLGVFQRNNWNNDDIVPYMRAKTITTKEGRTHYNPSMKFLPDSVKEAVVSNSIPPVMTLSQNNREAASEYVVYTWEKELELLTEDEIKNNKPAQQRKLIKEKKAEMRRAGDFSYINKGLFRKVVDKYGVPMETKDFKGNPYFVYKAINAWGDSYRANEFWATDHKSVIDNGFIKVEDVDNDVIINKFLNDKKVKTKATPTGSTPAGLSFDTLTEFAPERKEQLLSNFAARHKMTKEQARKYIDEALKDDRDKVIAKLKECY